jgi:small subunit ribosomal protein S1
VTSQIEDENSIQDMGMGELLDSVEDMKPLRRGDIVEGIIMRADQGGEGILLNVGGKAEGHVPSNEMRSLSSEAVENFKVGDEILAMVVRGETDEGSAILSIDRAVGETGWKTLQDALDAGTRMSGKIIGFNRGGAIVETEGVQGFVPMSQLATVSRERSQSAAQNEAGEEGGEEKPPAESPDVGRVIDLKVLELNRGRNRAILSERQAMQEVREQHKAKLIDELTEGEVRHGRVTGISNFGAFVDLGGADGLIHISELSWSNVSSPEDIVKVGQEVDVYVLRVDSEQKKIALSLKRLQPEPWETIDERYHVGDIVDATVTKLTEFGAFARVEDAVEGLIHISELTTRMINHPREVVREGDAVKLMILRIEPERRRLGLSLKQAEEQEGYAEE